MADGAVYMGYTPAQLDEQYDVRRSVPDVDAYFARWSKLSAKALRSRSVERDLGYGRSKREKIDLYPPKGKGPHPVLVYFHGGYWRMRDKEDFAFLAPALNEDGVMVAMAEYALCPSVTIDELVAQCRRALVWVDRRIKRHGGDPARIYVAGHSAGGHIASMLAATDWAAEGIEPAPKIRGAFAISGLYDLAPFPHTFLQPDLRLTPEQVARNSPIRLVRRTPAPTPIMLAVGLGESAEFQRQMEAYGDALGAAGIRHDMVRVGGADHFSILDCLADSKHLLRRSLMRLMRP